MNKTVQALILLLSIPGSALANDAGILRCRGITGASARLACYDALVVPAAESKAAASKPAGQSESGSSPAASSPPSTASLASVQQHQFGLENRAGPGTDAIESHIPGRFEGWDAKSNLKLANGQVWQIADDSSRYLQLNDPKVRIRRGVLGAFYLEFEQSNYSPRVRRVQ